MRSDADSIGKNQDVPTYCCDGARIIESERRRLALTDGEPLTGIAFSGGGIRSASFALGAVEALSNRGALESFHYMSTVSGGGYLGAAITWLRARYGSNWADQLGYRDDSGARGSESMLEQKAAEREEDSVTLASMHEIAGNAKQGRLATGTVDTNHRDLPGGDNTPRPGAWLAYLRQHGNYLLPSSISPLALLGVALRGAVVSIAIYLSLLIVIAYALIRLRIVAAPWVAEGVYATAHATFHIGAFQLMIDVLAIFVVGCIGLSMATLVASFSWQAGKSTEGAPLAPGKGQFGLALLCASLALAGVLWALRVVGSAFRSCANTSSLACSLVEGTTIAIAVLAAVGTVLTLFLAITRSGNWYYACRVIVQQRLGALLTLGIVFGGLAALPILYGWTKNGQHVLSAGNLLTLLGGLGAAVQAFIGRGFKTQSRFLNQALVLVSMTFVVSGLVLLAYAAAISLHTQDGRGDGYVIAILLISLATAAATNLNLFNLGRMYRDRLMETFQPSTNALRENCWERAIEADGTDLSDLWPPRSGSPRLLPLINCSAVLGDARSDKYRNRGSDSFVLSPLFCGSDATGWRTTRTFADEHLTLATAVATSGAAVNPHAAGGGRGITRDRLVSSLMFLFQVRLGSWVLNPALACEQRPRRLPVLTRSWASIMGQRPNFLVPGIWGGLLGRGMNEQAPYIELTDGGHFDNTGVYELLRRRCRFIVLIQASADPAFEMEDLGNVVQKARVDFGAEIDFIPQYGLDQIRPLKADAATGLAYAERGFALAEIKYSGELEPGLLLYVQATRLRGAHADVARTDESSVGIHADVISYAMREHAFPNESTLDQFFNEPQLEAYRELGYATVKGCIEHLCGASNALTAADLFEAARLAASNDDDPGNGIPT